MFKSAPPPGQQIRSDSPDRPGSDLGILVFALGPADPSSAHPPPVASNDPLSRPGSQGP